MKTKRQRQRCFNCQHAKIKRQTPEDSFGGTMYYICGKTYEPAKQDGLYCRYWEGIAVIKRRSIRSPKFAKLFFEANQ